jgi:hypothetical protein
MVYLTFLDIIMAITFVVNIRVVIYNVYLKWLENHERVKQVNSIDRVADFVYQLGYMILSGATIAYFF